MKKNNEERSYTTLDAYRAGFLKLKGHEPTLIEQGDKIVFAFSSSDSLKKDIAEYENGAVVDAFKFSLAIKSVKTEIHMMRERRQKSKSYQSLVNNVIT